MVRRLQVDPPADVDLRALHALAHAVALRLVRSGGLPLRRAGEPWRIEDAEDLVQEAWGSGRISRAVARSTSDAQLSKLLRSTLHQQAIDLLRRAGDSALFYRVTDVLEDGPYHLHPNDHWYVSSIAQGLYTGPSAALVAAAFAVHINVYPQRDEARATSFASREHLEAVISAILVRAGQPVAFERILYVVGERVAAPPVRGIEQLDDQDVVVDPRLEDRVESADFIATLDSEERAALPFLDLSDRELGARIGKGKTYANTLRARIRTKIEGSGQDAQMLRSADTEAP